MRKRNPLAVHECETCGRTFKTRVLTKKYCSEKCYLQAIKDRSKEQNRFLKWLREYLLPMFKMHNCPICGRMLEEDNDGVFCSSECREQFEKSLSISLNKLPPEMSGMSCSELTSFTIFGYRFARALRLCEPVKKGFKDER